MLYCLIMSEKIDHFLRDLERRKTEGSDGSISIHFLSFVGIVLGNSTSSLFCGFAFAFDLAAITFTLDCDACCSGRSARISVLL